MKDAEARECEGEDYLDGMVIERVYRDEQCPSDIDYMVLRGRNGVQYVAYPGDWVIDRSPAQNIADSKAGVS